MLSLAEAVPLGIMVEPPYGEPDLPSLLECAVRPGPGHFRCHRAGPVPDPRPTCRWRSRPGLPGISPRLGPWTCPALALLTRNLFAGRPLFSRRAHNQVSMMTGRFRWVIVAVIAVVLGGIAAVSLWVPAVPSPYRLPWASGVTARSAAGELSVPGNWPVRQRVRNP